MLPQLHSDNREREELASWATLGDPGISAAHIPLHSSEPRCPVLNRSLRQAIRNCLMVRSSFLNPCTIDILSWIMLCCGGPVQCIAALRHLPSTCKEHPSPSCGDQKCLHTWQKSPGGQNHLHWRTTGLDVSTLTPGTPDGASSLQTHCWMEEKQTVT